MDPTEVFYDMLIDLYSRRGRAIADLRRFDPLEDENPLVPFRWSSMQDGKKIIVPVVKVNHPEGSLIMLGQGQYGFCMGEDEYVDIGAYRMSEVPTVTEYENAPVVILTEPVDDNIVNAMTFNPSEDGRPGPLALETVMEDAVSEEDYEFAAVIRDLKIELGFDR